MTEDKKKQLAEAFDNGELPDETKPMEIGEAAYVRRLHSLDRALHQQPEVSLPAGFVTMVMNRLPAAEVAMRRVMGIRDVMLPLLLLAVLVLSFFFADFLGLAPLARTMSDGLTAAGEGSAQIGFIAVTASGILFASWFIVSSFFGIRSRRITRN